MLRNIEKLEPELEVQVFKTHKYLQGMSSSAPIVPTKVLGDPEELEKHLVMLQNGFPVGSYAAAATAVDGSNSQAPGGFEDRFIFTPPILELQQSDVQLHPVRFFLGLKIIHKFITYYVLNDCNI